MKPQKTTYKRRFKPTFIEIAKTATYKIGKTTVLVDGVFRKGNAETVMAVLARLIAEDAEKTQDK